MEREKATVELAACGAEFHRRGWVGGTGGNFSAVLRRDPLELAITASGSHKGALRSEQLLRVDGDGQILDGRGTASDELPLHLAVIRSRRAGSVLHTHSVWATLLSLRHAGDGGVAITGMEMLKGLAGVNTHDHQEWIPVLPNSADTTRLAKEVETVLGQHPSAHGFLLRGHGLYTWGEDIETARRHVEVLEFLLEVGGRSRTEEWPWQS